MTPGPTTRLEKGVTFAEERLGWERVGKERVGCSLRVTFTVLDSSLLGWGPFVGMGAVRCW